MNTTNNEIPQALIVAYDKLAPYSKKYRVDWQRYNFSLALLSKIPNFGQAKILDVGTGIGLIPLAISLLKGRAFGVEYYIFPENNNDMFGIADIEKLKKIWRQNNVDIQNADFLNEELPWNFSFDVIISEATIEHLKDPKKFIDKCYSGLSTGGYLLLATPNCATILKRIRFLLGHSPYWPIEQFYTDGNNFTGHWREYTVTELRTMCHLSGFKIVTTYNKNFLTSFKKITSWKKNIRAVFGLLGKIIPGGGDMNYILCKKE